MTRLQKFNAARTLALWTEETADRARTGRAGDAHGIYHLIDVLCGALADDGAFEESDAIRRTLENVRL